MARIHCCAVLSLSLFVLATPALALDIQRLDSPLADAGIAGGYQPLSVPAIAPGDAWAGGGLPGSGETGSVRGSIATLATGGMPLNAIPAQMPQDLPGFESPFPRGQVTIGLAWPCGPAVDSDQVGFYGGLALGVGFNFTRRPSAAIGVDGLLLYTVAVKMDEWDVEGTWTQISVGLPMRLGRTVSFYFRPGLCMEMLNSELSGYESDGDYWRATFDNSVAIGLVLGMGLDIILSDRISMGLNFHLAILGSPHEGETYWTNGSSWEYNDITGFISIAALWRFSIHF